MTIHPKLKSILSLTILSSLAAIVPSIFETTWPFIAVMLGGLAGWFCGDILFGPWFPKIK